MSKQRTWIIVAVVIAAGLLALRMGIPDDSHVAHQQVRSADDSAAPVVTPTPSPIDRPMPTIPATLNPTPPSAEAEIVAPPAPQPATLDQNPKLRPAKHFADAATAEKEQTPSQQIARIALSFVGMDQDAEDVWMAVIDDPAMPAEDRKNLIEDLNEDGFADPDHPTPDELPLIVNRLALIESIAPDAIDDVNLAAFAEAHKDLLEMFRRLTQ